MGKYEKVLPVEEVIRRKIYKPDLDIIEATKEVNGVENITRILRIRLDCKFDSTFAVSKVKEDVKFKL